MYPRSSERGVRGPSDPKTVFLPRAASNEAFLLLAVVGGAIAVLRWCRCAQPPANRVRPLPGSKTKAAKRRYASSTPKPSLLSARSIAVEAPRSGGRGYPALVSGEPRVWVELRSPRTRGAYSLCWRHLLSRLGRPRSWRTGLTEGQSIRRLFLRRSQLTWPIPSAAPGPPGQAGVVLPQGLLPSRSGCIISAGSFSIGIEIIPTTSREARRCIVICFPSGWSPW
jgi:hypothetical protein